MQVLVPRDGDDALAGSVLEIARQFGDLVVSFATDEMTTEHPIVGSEAFNDVEAAIGYARGVSDYGSPAYVLAIAAVPRQHLQAEQVWRVIVCRP